MTNSFLLLISFTFIACTVLFKLFHSFLFEKDKYEKRLKKYVISLNMEKTENKQPVNTGENNSLLKKMGQGIETVVSFSKYEQHLAQSGVNFSQGELFIGRCMAAVICMSVGYLFELHFIFILVCGGVGFQLPIMYVKKKRRKRLQRCSEQLGDALGTMTNALRAGFSFMQAMKMVAKELGDPLGPEFLKALQDINYGITVDDAFKSLLERLPDKDLEIVLNTLVIQRSSGGNLAYLLETMQETIIDRSRVKDEVKTLTAQGKMSSVIITMLPIALGVYIKLVNPEYFQMLFSHPLGWIMVIIGFTNLLLGWFFIKKIVNIEV